jgi:hypothetical protein
MQSPGFCPQFFAGQECPDSGYNVLWLKNAQEDQMTVQPTENADKALQNIDFVAWQIKRVQKDLHAQDVNRIFNSRSRLRSHCHLN